MQIKKDKASRLIPLLGVFIFIGIILYSDFSLKDFGALILDVGVVAFSAMFALKAIVFLSRSICWKILVKTLTPDQGIKFKSGFFFLHTTLAIFINAFSGFLGTIVSRPVALKLEYKVPLTVGAVSISLDIFLSTIITGLFCLPGVCYLLQLISLNVALLSNIGIIFALFFLVRVQHSLVISAVSRIVKLVYLLASKVPILHKRLTEHPQTVPALARIPRQEFRDLLLFSVVAHYAQVFLALTLVLALDLEMSPLLIVLMFPIAHIVANASFIVGIADLSVIGVFTLFGVTLDDSILFVIATRLFQTAISFTLTAGAYLFYRLLNQGRLVRGSL